GDGVNAVVGVRVLTVERASGRHADRARRVKRGGTGVNGRSVAPVDRISKLLDRLAADVERVVEARIGELADVGDRKLRAFVDRLVRCCYQRRGDVVDGDLERRSGHTAIVVGD